MLDYQVKKQDILKNQIYISLIINTICQFGSNLTSLIIFINFVL